MSDTKKILIAAISVVLVVAIVAGVSIGVLAGKVNNMEDQVAELAGLKQTVEALQSENDAMKEEIKAATANNEKLVTAEDFEAKLAAAIGEQNQTMQAIVSTAVKNQIEELGVEGLTEAQVKEIINAAVANCITEDEVNELIANSDTGLTEAQVKKLITNANAGYLTYAQIVNLIDDNIYDLRKYLEDMINGKTTTLYIDAEDIDGDTFIIDDDVLATVISGGYVDLLGDWTEINLVIDYEDDKEVWLWAETPVATLKNKVSEKAQGWIEALEASVSSVEDLEAALNYVVYTITIEDDIEWTLENGINTEATIIVAEGATVSIDLNDCAIYTFADTAIVNYGALTINGHDADDSNSISSKSCPIENYGDLIINGGTFAGKGAVASYDGTLEINGGNYYASAQWQNSESEQTLYLKNTKATINGGNFDASVQDATNAMINVAAGSDVTVNGGNFKNVNDALSNFDPYLFEYKDTGKLTINGGTFYGGWRFNFAATTDIYGGNFTVSVDGQSFGTTNPHVLTVYGGTFAVLTNVADNKQLATHIADHVATGYKAVKSGDVWGVISDEEGVDFAGSSEDLATAITNGATEVTLAGDMTIVADNLKNASDLTVVLTSDTTVTVVSGAAGSKNLTFTGDKSSTVVLVNTNPGYEGALSYQDNANLTFKGITFDASQISGICARGGVVIFEDCIITGELEKTIASKFVFSGCTFTDGVTQVGYGCSDVVFEDCKFETDGYGIKIYSEGTTPINLTVTNCSFKNTGSTAKSAIFLDHIIDGITYDITIEDCTFDGFTAVPTPNENKWAARMIVEDSFVKTADGQYIFSYQTGAEGGNYHKILTDTALVVTVK